MKPLIAITLLILIACNSDKKETLIKPGAYKMISQALKSHTLDTTYLELQQLKIYTGEYMMFANFFARDSISGFGVGSYSAEKDTVTEHVIFSASDSVKDDTPRVYKLYIENKDTGIDRLYPIWNHRSENNTHRRLFIRWNSCKNSLGWCMERIENILRKRKGYD
jgi:hypothetical protein